MCLAVLCSELEAAIGPADAVICTTGFSGGLNPFGSGSAAAVDEQGTISLVNAAKARRVQAFVLLSSLLTNAPAVGQAANPNYAFLQLFGGVLSHKLVRDHTHLHGLHARVCAAPEACDDKRFVPHACTTNACARIHAFTRC